MPPKRHTISITPVAIDGIFVYDNKRQKGMPPQQLNKISTIVSFSRNRKIQTSLPSRPIIPGKNHKHSIMQNKEGLRYMTLWNDDIESIQANTVILETNLHQKGSKQFKNKTYDVVVGLKRGDSTTVLALSVLHIDGPMQGQIELPLYPIGVNVKDDNDVSDSGGILRNGKSEHIFDMEPVTCEGDNGRLYKLTKSACLKVNVEVFDSRSK